MKVAPKVIAARQAVVDTCEAIWDNEQDCNDCPYFKPDRLFFSGSQGETFCSQADVVDGVLRGTTQTRIKD